MVVTWSTNPVYHFLTSVEKRSQAHHCTEFGGGSSPPLYGVWSQISQWSWVSPGVCVVVGFSSSSPPNLYFRYFFMFLRFFIFFVFLKFFRVSDIFRDFQCFFLFLIFFIIFSFLRYGNIFIFSLLIISSCF